MSGQFDQPQSLEALYLQAEQRRKSLDSFANKVGDVFEENLKSAITAFQECLELVSRASLFSRNESLDDVASRDLKYLLLDFRLADLMLQNVNTNRKSSLASARLHYERFLRALDDYDALSKTDSQLFETYLDQKDTFSTASKTDATARREAKIAQFKQEKEFKQKLEILQQNPLLEDNDEAASRELHLTQIQYCVQQTFQSLESIAQELQILSMAPPNPESQTPNDLRERNGHTDGFSERLDMPGSRNQYGRGGPILDKNGKPLRPFTLLDNRTRMQQGVFRPDHSLPTMTIDEYLEEERRRGGIIEGGGPQSGIQPEPDEDNIVKADEETLKARAWDDFKEDNPRGSGNTMNMG